MTHFNLVCWESTVIGCTSRCVLSTSHLLSCHRSPGGRAMCDAPVFVNENGILLFKYRMVPRKGRKPGVISGSVRERSAYRPKNEQFQDLNRVTAGENTQFHLMQKQATPWHILCGVNKRYPPNPMVSHFLKKIQVFSAVSTTSEMVLTFDIFLGTMKAPVSGKLLGIRKTWISLNWTWLPKPWLYHPIYEWWSGLSL